MLAVPEGPHLMGIDGLYLHRGTLIGVQNGTKVQRVVRATLATDGGSITHVEVLDEAHPRFAVPTTGVIVDDALYYVATSQLDAVDPEHNTLPPLAQLVPNAILRLPLAAVPTDAIVGTGPSAAGCVSRSP